MIWVIIDPWYVEVANRSFVIVVPNIHIFADSPSVEEGRSPYKPICGRGHDVAESEREKMSPGGDLQKTSSVATHASVSEPLSLS
jgi:hypothetical protein